MTRYPAELTLREALARYFEDNGFGADGGYGAAWVDFKLGPLPMPFPNTEPRRRAVRFHDLHHIVTGYATDLTGEFEISAWEIASGCRDFVAAWQLNLGGLFGGLLVAPRRTLRAFVRGRHTGNLYAEEYAPLLGATVGDTRARLGTDQDVPPATAADRALFILASVAGLVVGLLSFALFVPLALVAAPVLHVLAQRARRKAPFP